MAKRLPHQLREALDEALQAGKGPLSAQRAMHASRLLELREALNKAPHAGMAP